VRFRCLQGNPELRNSTNHVECPHNPALGSSVRSGVIGLCAHSPILPFFRESGTLAGMDKASPITTVSTRKPWRLTRTRLAVFSIATLGLLAVWVVSNVAGIALVKSVGTTQTRYGFDDGHFYMNRDYMGGIATHSWRIEQSDLYPKQFEWVSGQATRKIMVPIWFVFLVLGGIVFSPFRFSLRILFVAVSLIAVILGLGVWIAG
jgi:hypothetical protein